MAEELDQERIDPTNLSPRAVNDRVTVEEDNPVQIAQARVLANDADPDGDTLTVTEVGEAENGAAALSSTDSTITYTPEENFNGADSFTYTISDGRGGQATATVNVNVLPVNDPPVVAEQGTATTNEDEPFTTDPRELVEDPDDDEVTVTEASAGRGTVALNEDGTIAYTPEENFNGQDTIRFAAADPEAATTQGTIDVTVNPVDDLAVAQDDTAETTEDTPVTVDVLANDQDVDTPREELTVRVLDQPADGTATVNPDGTVTFTPADNFNGSATFSYIVEGADATDGTDGGVPDGQQAVADGEAVPDADGDAVPDEGGATDGEGIDGIDASLPNVATVTVTVTPVNDAPQIAEGQETTTAVTDEDTPVTLNVLALEDDQGNPIVTDIDEGDVLRVSEVGGAENGAVVLNEDGTVTYTPDEDFSGTDGFTYTVADDQGGTATGRIDVTVTEVNDPPVAVNDAAVADAATQGGTAIDVLSNDSDPDGALDFSSLEIVDGPANGEAGVNDGLIVYTPNPGFGDGQDQLTYRVADDDGAFSDAATVTVDVQGGEPAQATALSQEEVLDGDDDELFSGGDQPGENDDGGTPPDGEAGAVDAPVASAPSIDVASVVDEGQAVAA